jgi:hypothetical protein
MGLVGQVRGLRGLRLKKVDHFWGARSSDARDARTRTLERLSPLIGEWSLETSVAPPGAVRARSVVEWGPGRRLLLQRTEIDHPDAPDGLWVIAAESDGDRYNGHYFDSRGIVRLYAMTFDGGMWTLLREAPDFTPVEFASGSPPRCRTAAQ